MHGAGAAAVAGLLMFTCMGDGAQVAGSSAGAVRFDSARAWRHLREQVSFGPRPPGSEAAARTRRYLIAELRAAGILAREQRFEAVTPIGPIAMVNVVATIPGARPQRIALASHYDTKRAPAFRFVGANDGGSSTAALLELGRVLAARKNPFTIDLFFFDGEEAIEWEWAGYDNTYGSRHYVEHAQAAGTLVTLKALILLDLIGDRHLNVRREASSTRWMTDLVWSTARQLGHGAHFLDQEMTIADDHSAFLRAGVPAVNVIDLDYAAWHTPRDDLDAVSARSLQIVGDVVLAVLPRLEERLLGQAGKP
jgi:glutaminyl-peptide cyclotransferase